MIDIVSVSKTYAKSATRAVDNASLAVRGGEIFGFLGPNGAGKTTTIKMATGVLRPDSGSISINGLDIVKKPLEAKRAFGYVPDNPELFAKLKAHEYLNFVADAYGVPTGQRQERITRYTRLFDIEAALASGIGSFSHGMKQKLMVTASLLHDPDVWILDEPMVGLDPRAAFDLKEIMRERSQSGKTVFFSTHVMEVAEKLCDRLAIINKGKIVFTGTLEELRGLRGSDESLENLFLELVEGGPGGPGK